MTTEPAPASRLDPEPLSRRDFLGRASWWTALSVMGFSLLGILRLPKAAVLSSPSKKFRVTLPESLPPGMPFIPPGRPVALYRDAKGIYAVSLRCTHLGCIVKQSASGFECPCHGSQFGFEGEVHKGPAPKPLVWHPVQMAGGQIIVDEGATVAPGTRVTA
jgi:Rieske Fe-S protein